MPTTVLRDPLESLAPTGFEEEEGFFSSFADLPPEAGAKWDPEKRVWYREVTEHTSASRLNAQGVLEFQQRLVRRPIALTRDIAVDAGYKKRVIPDYWDPRGGGSWVRHGTKREREWPRNLGSSVMDGTERWVTASDVEQAAAREEAQRRLAFLPQLPMEAASEATAEAVPEASGKGK